MSLVTTTDITVATEEWGDDSEPDPDSVFVAPESGLYRFGGNDG